MTHYLLLTFFGLLLATALAPAVSRSRAMRNLLPTLVMVASGAGAAGAAKCLWLGESVEVKVSAITPFAFALRVDRLSAFFLLLMCCAALPVAVFASSYLPRHYSPGKTNAIWALTSLFIMSMAVVVTASTTFAFLFGWELMTLLSAGLILLDGTDEQRLHNVFIYLLMMHAGTAAVIGAFFVLSAAGGSWDFESMRAAGNHLSPLARAAIFLLAFIGFSTKAGIVPLHLWLPRAHPIAPTPVSALMSGVMLKTAIYGLVRFSFDFLHGGPHWAGYLVLAAGAVSAVLGILYAIGEPDLKRLLAYSSVENIGVIYLATGAALLFMSQGATSAAALALTGALFHSLNHALFKSLLFLGAGAVSDATHTLALDSLGGLVRRMPVTAMLCLVACAAIGGLPLLNGFAGEWLIYLSFLEGSQLPKSAARMVLPLMTGVLALTAALTATCFLKLYGVAFLGRPRSAQAESAQEPPRSMQLGMALLAFACLFLGVFPWLAAGPAAAVAVFLIPKAPPVAVAASLGSIFPALLIGLCLIALPTALLGRRKRAEATWACGLPGLSPHMQYTSVSFSKPVRTVFSSVYRPDRQVNVTAGASAYFPTGISYRSFRTTSYEKHLYRPLVNAVLGIATGLRRLQTGNVQVYLLYIFLTLVALLAVLRLRS